MIPRLCGAATLAAALLVSAGCDRAENADETGAPAGETPAAAGASGFDVEIGDEALREERRASGLVVEVHREGSGGALASGETGVIAFVMRLASDGRVLDSSERRRATLWVPLEQGRAVAGLIEGLEGMRVGEVRRLRVPHAMAYGESGRAPVPPRADLVFDVRLVEISEHD